MTPDRDRRVVLLCGRSFSSQVVYAALNEIGCDLSVILENPPSRWLRLRRRAKRLGLPTVTGQMAFQVIAAPVLARAARRRIAELRAQLPHVSAEQLASVAHHVASANDSNTGALIVGIEPALVVVNGTRILSGELLESIAVPVINMHMGITPCYRGVHGGYWAIAEGRHDLVGTTVHMVDAGVDTGRVLGRAFFSVTASDNFATYPYLHLKAGLPVLVNNVTAQLQGRSGQPAKPLDLPSKQRYHPTLLTYLRRRLTMGAR